VNLYCISRIDSKSKLNSYYVVLHTYSTTTFFRSILGTAKYLVQYIVTIKRSSTTRNHLRIWERDADKKKIKRAIQYSRSSSLWPRDEIHKSVDHSAIMTSSQQRYLLQQSFKESIQSSKPLKQVISPSKKFNPPPRDSQASSFRELERQKPEGLCNRSETTYSP